MRWLANRLRAGTNVADTGKGPSELENIVKLSYLEWGYIGFNRPLFFEAVKA
ncbi:hypothetical protein SOASR029_30990 [Budvicia aquatica]|nr:hypothetical protein SOASR029_30990 [Budvicia aquatica]